MDNEFIILATNDYQDSKGRLQIEPGVLSTSKFRNGFNSFLESFSDAFSGLNDKLGDFYIDEIDVKLDVSLSGGIRLIGSAEAGTTGGITLKIRRKKNE